MQRRGDRKARGDSVRQKLGHGRYRIGYKVIEWATKGFPTGRAPRAHQGEADHKHQCTE